MYLLWKAKEALLDFIDPERSIPNDASHYKTISHITWIESKGKYGCPGATSTSCPHFRRGCHRSKCEHYTNKEQQNEHEN